MSHEKKDSDGNVVWSYNGETITKTVDGKEIQQMDGSGEYYSKTPEQEREFKGTFKDNKFMDGHMNYKNLKDGVVTSSYDGGYQNGKKNGHGTENFPPTVYENGQVTEEYTGEWKDDKRCGEGTLITYENKKMTQKYVGTWEDNYRTKGKQQFYKDEVLTREYDGEWKEFHKHGQGTEKVYKNGQVTEEYTGNWKDNNRCGMGTITYHQQTCETNDSGVA